MKIKFVVALVLAVVCVLPIVTGVSTAQRDDPNKTNLADTVYLPFITKPPCEPAKPTVYIAVSDPVVRVGEIVTVTGALVNDCAYVGRLGFGVERNPAGILSVTSPLTNTLSGVQIGGYAEDQITLLATAPGVATMTMRVNYETDPPGWYVSVTSSPTAIRVLP